ncbi:TetR/AcrR family transcriptional regulator [Rhizobium lentis]|uniref:TetR/AcrR family transcriptional regulator n=1 Tax=Rhizobium lentis TaxID=1138194 RepID=A0ABS7IBL1_9HYPH|nr:TetR/AcrR family transcriptional regulator [Rhizobium lentis]MBX4957194.1 TetR/AcrR family transcriptional regulator [Rhizobium lentis]MBX4987184.1 TetR/AcrR family transcriptional regulator [Rhizobium lentis]MBX5005628.1 TetR/AcrR family transcriptional regulator [Rhizobium lentis]MBX5027190.1 TetR/AcrR family transcriptional regulator [Rhizobium lentis]MBX5033735.1 TetR/AcrR family transcriptional regulator [Rhizobium lentis]
MPADSVSKPRTKPPEERRDELMTAAERLFLAKGVEQTTIEEITSGAGVAKGTFYLHFSSKVDVLEALRDRFVKGVLEGIVAAVEAQRQEDLRGKLAAWSIACATGYLDAAGLHHLAFVAAPPATRDGLSRNVLIAHLSELIAAGAAEHAWSADDPGFTAVFLFNALHGVVNQPGIGETPSARAELLHKIETHFLHALGPVVRRRLKAAHPPSEHPHRPEGDPA